MDDKVKIGIDFDGAKISRREVLATALMQSIWDVECFDVYGRLRWKSEGNPNKMTDEGLNHLLDSLLNGGDTPNPQITAWYVVPFEDDYTPDGDETYAVPEYTESTAYDETERQVANFAAASGQAATNVANKASLTFNATKTIYGAGLVGGGSAPETKSDVAGGGVLLCLAPFASAKPVESTDTLKITANVTAQRVV